MQISQFSSMNGRNRFKTICFIKLHWNSQAVQWLGLDALTAKDLGSILGWGTKIL